MYTQILAVCEHSFKLARNQDCVMCKRVNIINSQY
jgi:hypothetical protein